MSKKYLILISAIAVVAVFFFIKNNNQQKPVENNSAIIFFYGEGCPHCEKVEKYFQEKGIHNKINFEEKEVYKNTGNAKLLSEKAKVCGIKENEIGVPLLWADGKCHIGDEEIIKFFNEKVNEEK